MSQDIDMLRHDDYERHRAETILMRRHVTSRDVSRRRDVRHRAESSREGRRFMVRSLGWTTVDDGVGDGVGDERHVHSRVHKSINRLSLGRHDMSDAVGRWGDVCISLRRRYDHRRTQRREYKLKEFNPFPQNARIGLNH